MDQVGASGAETEISHDNEVNAMAVDVLAHCRQLIGNCYVW